MHPAPCGPDSRHPGTQPQGTRCQPGGCRLRAFSGPRGWQGEKHQDVLAEGPSWHLGDAPESGSWPQLKGALGCEVDGHLC